MNAWVPASIVLAVLAVVASQLDSGSGEIVVDGCRSPDAATAAAAAPPDFLFATAQEWRRYALEAELDRRR